MTEILRASDPETGKVYEVPYPDPTLEAAFFKGLSDEVWENGERLLIHGSIATEEDPGDVLIELNTFMEGIDKKLVIAGQNKPLDVGFLAGEERTISAESLQAPKTVWIQTENLDHFNKSKVVVDNGQRVVVDFIDGNQEYYRSLSVMFRFMDEGYPVTIEYGLHRTQSEQDVFDHAKLSAIVFHPYFSETGYEGHQVFYDSISAGKELQFLNLVKRIGGLAATYGTK